MTIILMDVDGVLNPLFSFTLHEDGYTTFSIGWATWSLNSKTHGTWMRELNNKAKIVWCSSWENDCNSISNFFRLPELDYVKFHARKNGISEGETWKLRDVIDYLGTSDELVIWLDDEFQQDAWDWAETRKNTMLIPCNSSIGWTLEDYDRINTVLNLEQNL